MVLHVLKGGETYFNFILFWLIFSNIFFKWLIFLNYDMHRRYLIEQRQENSAFIIRDQKQNMINLSLGGAFMVFIFELKTKIKA